MQTLGCKHSNALGCRHYDTNAWMQALRYMHYDTLEYEHLDAVTSIRNVRNQNAFKRFLKFPINSLSNGDRWWISLAVNKSFDWLVFIEIKLHPSDCRRISQPFASPGHFGFRRSKGISNSWKFQALQLERSNMFISWMSKEIRKPFSEVFSEISSWTSSWSPSWFNWVETSSRTSNEFSSWTSRALGKLWTLQKNLNLDHF